MHRLQGKLHARNLLLVGLSALIAIGLQPQTASSSPVAKHETRRETNNTPMLSERALTPQLPPLGDSSRYLPQEAAIRLVLKLSERRVYVYRGDQMQANYPVAVGKRGWETPTGTFAVIQMDVNPIWQSPWTNEVSTPGPNSPLGVRWIGFWTDGTDHIGFHGTPTLSSIGKAASHGCVRMRNEDVVALFEQVQMGTPVVVEP
ncbi:MAG: L,D-transpeptidase [Hormoscilla sp.]